MKKNKVVIDRFEGDFAVVVKNGDTFDVHKKLFPENVKEGDTVYITVSSESEEGQSQGEIARALLNEVLKDE